MSLRPWAPTAPVGTGYGSREGFGALGLHPINFPIDGPAAPFFPSGTVHHQGQNKPDSETNGMLTHAVAFDFDSTQQTEEQAKLDRGPNQLLFAAQLPQLRTGQHRQQAKGLSRLNHYLKSAAGRMRFRTNQGNQILNTWRFLGVQAPGNFWEPCGVTTLQPAKRVHIHCIWHDANDGDTLYLLLVKVPLSSLDQKDPIYQPEAKFPTVADEYQRILDFPFKQRSATTTTTTSRTLLTKPTLPSFTSLEEVKKKLEFASRLSNGLTEDGKVDPVIESYRKHQKAFASLPNPEMTAPIMSILGPGTKASSATSSSFDPLLDGYVWQFRPHRRPKGYEPEPIEYVRDGWVGGYIHIGTFMYYSTGAPPGRSEALVTNINRFISPLNDTSDFRDTANQFLPECEIQLLVG